MIHRDEDMMAEPVEVTDDYYVLILTNSGRNKMRRGVVHAQPGRASTRL